MFFSAKNLKLFVRHISTADNRIHGAKKSKNWSLFGRRRRAKESDWRCFGAYLFLLLPICQHTNLNVVTNITHLLSFGHFCQLYTPTLKEEKMRTFLIKWNSTTTLANGDKKEIYINCHNYFWHNYQRKKSQARSLWQKRAGKCCEKKEQIKWGYNVGLFMIICDC